MNAITPNLRPYSSDQTFLPAALEILEVPASPVRMVLLLFICGFVGIALIWASIGRLDVVAAAQGKIIPIGKVKTVQPLTVGKIASILVQNGDKVAAGQALAQLDDRDLVAKLTDQQLALAAARTEEARRAAAITAAGMHTPGGPPINVLTRWANDAPADIRAREQQVLESDLTQLQAGLASIEAQIAQKSVEQAGLSATISRQEEYVSALSQRATMRETLVDKQAGSKADWLDALGTLKAQEVALAQERGQLAASAEEATVLRREWDKTLQEFIHDNEQRRADVAKQADALSQRVRQAQVALEAMTLRSPIDGTVQASVLTSIGQVVSPAEEVMRIVPAGAPIEVEAYLPNADAGFVRVGQKAVVKVDAFPFTRYGTIAGRIESIGRDAITSNDAQGLSADATHALASPRGSADPSAGLVFPVVVSLESPEILADGHSTSLSPGMGVTVEVDTGSRTILEYLFSPLVETTSSAMHER
jgi:hemolysin D